MSATTIRYLHCDGCGDVFDNAPDPSSSLNQESGESVTDQRARARLDGWLVSQPGGRDYCDGCRVAHDKASTDLTNP